MPRDDAYLLDRLLAARKIESFLTGVDESDFARNEILQHAVMRLLTIVGEAASKVSAEGRATLVAEAEPAVPGGRIVADAIF